MDAKEYIQAAAMDDPTIIQGVALDAMSWKDNPNKPIPRGEKILSREEMANRVKSRAAFNRKMTQLVDKEVAEYSRVCLVADMLLQGDKRSLKAIEEEARRVLSMQPKHRKIVSARG